MSSLTTNQAPILKTPVLKTPILTRGVLIPHIQTCHDSHRESDARKRDIALLNQMLFGRGFSVAHGQAHLSAYSINHAAQLKPRGTLRNYSMPGNYSPQAELNMRLVDEIWQHIRRWTAKQLKRVITTGCPISVWDHGQISVVGAVGVFCVFADGTCEIRIDRTIIDNTDYLLVVLAHEYMHYVHYRIVRRQDYQQCPKLFSEGLAEVGARAFYTDSNYRLPSELCRSWSPSYELGRRVVSQIASEGFGLDGFARGFLHDVAADCPWKKLDGLF